MKWIEILEKLEKKKCFIFSVEEFKAIAQSSGLASKRLLQRYAKRGLVARVKKGLYLVLSKKPPDMFIANKLCSPSYVSFSYALSYYHIIPEAVYTVTSAAAASTREFDVLGRLFSFSKIKAKAYTGYTPIKIDNYTILLATPEKALADFLYFTVLKKRTLNERLDLGRIKTKRFLGFIKLFNNRKLTDLAKGLICYQTKK